jgi:hypothetical protein
MISQFIPFDLLLVDPANPSAVPRRALHTTVSPACPPGRPVPSALQDPGMCDDDWGEGWWLAGDVEMHFSFFFFGFLSFDSVSSVLIKIIVSSCPGSHFSKECIGLYFLRTEFMREPRKERLD